MERKKRKTGTKEERKRKDKCLTFVGSGAAKSYEEQSFSFFFLKQAVVMWV